MKLTVSMDDDDFDVFPIIASRGLDELYLKESLRLEQLQNHLNNPK